jgi:CRISPR system Cascade subunit CasB
MSDESDASRFIGYLQRLRDTGDRAALAHLRRGLGRPVGACARRDAVVFRCPGGLPRDEDASALVASLFALHPDSGGPGGLGRSMNALAVGANSPSVEKRFVALLNADREDLGEHLRHAVSLLKSKDVAVEWRQLFLDVLDWDRERRPVQRRWSREFWTVPDAPTAPVADGAAGDVAQEPV